MRLDLIAQRSASGGQRLAVAARLRRLPGVPGRALVLVFQRAEQLLLVETAFGVVAKAIELFYVFEIMCVLEMI